MAILILSVTKFGVGQTTGDYRSSQTGNWGTAGTWERFNGTNWVAASTTPTATNANVITVRNSHIVTVASNVSVDQVVIDNGGQVTVNSGITLTIANGTGTDMLVNGILRNLNVITTTGTLQFGSNGVYQHARNGGTIPTATWDSNSNCIVTGVTTTVPSGLGQNFGNFTWNCTSQTGANINIGGMGNRTITSFNLLNTNSGSITYVTSTAQTLSVTDYVHSSGTFNVSTGTAAFTLNVKGNFTHSGGTISETSSGSGNIVFNGSYIGNSGMQTFTSGGTISNTINFTVNSGAYLQMAAPGTTITGAGAFTIASGATLGITSTAGITTSGSTGNIQVTGTRSFNTGASYIYNGTSAQNTGNGLPATLINLIINNPGGAVTFNSARNITNNFTITSGSVANLGTFNHTAGELMLDLEGTVSGSWGSSSSTATYKNDTYFAATSGIVNVTNNRCTSPADFNVTGGGGFCSDGPGVSVGLLGSQPGVNYQLFNGTSTVGTPVAGTGSAISFGNQTVAGTYTVVATNTTTFCTSSMGGNAKVSVLPQVPNYGATVTNTTCPASADGAIAINNLPAALTFANADFDYVSTGNSFLSGRGAFTLEGWIKANKATIGNRIGLFGQNDAIEFGFINNSNIQCWTSGGGSVNVPLSSYPDDNGWHHIAATGNGTNIIIYIDGVQVGIGGSATSNYGTSTDNVRIGAAVFDPTSVTTGGFNGQMLKVGFWNIALSPAEIQSLAQEFKAYAGNEPGLIAGYNFFEGLGTTLTSLPAGSNGTFVNTPVWSEAFNFSWTKTGDAGFSASTKNISSLTTGEYNLTVSNESCTRATSYTVGSNYDKPLVSAISTPSALCADASLNPVSPSVNPNGSAIIVQGWQLEIAVGSNTFTNLTVPYSVSYSDNGKKFRYYATNGCGTAYSNEVILTVNPLPTAAIASGNGPICENENAVFVLTGTNSATVTYKINSGTDLTVPLTGGNATITLYNVSVNQTLTLVSVTDGICTRSLTGNETIVVHLLPATGEIIPD